MHRGDPHGDSKGARTAAPVDRGPGGEDRARSPLARSDGSCLGGPRRGGPGSAQTRGPLRPDPFGDGLGPRHRREVAPVPQTHGSPGLAVYSRGRPGRRGLGRRARAAVLQIGDEAAAERLDLEQALTEISAEERRTIELRYYQGLDGAELAAALGVPTPGAARVRVCRALQALRTHLAPAEEEVFP